MITESMITEKVQDLLSLEARAAEIYEEALGHPESERYRAQLTELMRDEQRHIALVKKVLEIVSTSL